MKSLFLRTFSLLLAIGAYASLHAKDEDIDWLEPGDAFPSFEAKDQHEQDFPMPEDTQFVFVTFDMGTGKRANAFFAEKGADWLPEKNAVFLSNIYGMPGIARTFAMPKMRRYPHRIMLADEKGLLDNYPNEKGKVTVFALNADGKISKIAFWDPKAGEPPLLK
ncbi:MAG: hypothetical protein KJT03_14275 [Verrucomicrobiae bacterium]|nr:hypothetical protein [Verrucomicrobiae bacterium]